MINWERMWKKVVTAHLNHHPTVA